MSLFIVFCYGSIPAPVRGKEKAVGGEYRNTETHNSARFLHTSEAHP